MIKISILIPIYGTEKYIERCAISLFEQTYKNIEYIFVNDCTKDNSIDILLSIIQKYPERKNQIRIINHEYNQGLAGARLTGLIHSTGDYIWCVDSDDYVETNAIDKCIKYMKQGYDLIAFNYIIKNELGLTKNLQHNLTVENVLNHYISPSIWKYIIHRSLYFNYKILPIIGINYSEDYLLTARLILVAQKKIQLKNEYLYYYECTNENSYMHNIKVSNLESKVETINIIKDFYREKGVERKYQIPLSISMGYLYTDLRKADKNNRLLPPLKQEIFKKNRLLYSIISLISSKKTCYRAINFYRAITVKFNII
jgi:glycosyltransferase involved in cell wall biosynthesis